MSLFIYYFSITTSIFLLASYTGESVSIKLFGGGDDGDFYWQQAKNVFNNLEWTRTSIYPYVAGKFMMLFNIENVYIIRLMNFIVFILLVNTSLLILKFQLTSENYYKHRKYLIIYYFFYLSIIMQINLSIYRDVWIYFLYSACILISLICFFKHKYKYGILLVILLFFLFQFRPYATFCFITSSFLFLILKKNKNAKKIVIILIFLAFLFFLFFKNLKLPIVNMTLVQAIEFRNTSITKYPGGSQMGALFDTNNFISLGVNYIYSFISNLIGPLPWQINSYGTFIAFVFETIPMIYIIIFIYKNRHNLNLFDKYLMFHSFVWIAMVAISNDNIGTAARLRVLAWNLIIIVCIDLLTSSKTNGFLFFSYFKIKNNKK